MVRLPTWSLPGAAGDPRRHTTRKGIPDVWGATAAEVAAPFPCDEQLVEADAALFRAVTVDAEWDTVFRWLTQLNVAPYSYDLVDNLGRRSPRALTPGRAPGGGAARHDDLRARRLPPRRPSHAASSSAAGCPAVRLDRPQLHGPRRGPAAHPPVAKPLVRHPGRRSGRLETRVLAWGDLLMMRRQLLTLKLLAEAPCARDGVVSSPAGQAPV